jgi:hypothetical protein
MVSRPAPGSRPELFGLHPLIPELFAARLVDIEQIGRPGRHRQDTARGVPFRRDKTDRFNLEARPRVGDRGDKESKLDEAIFLIRVIATPDHFRLRIGQFTDLLLGRLPPIPRVRAVTNGRHR